MGALFGRHLQRNHSRHLSSHTPHLARDGSLLGRARAACDADAAHCQGGHSERGLSHAAREGEHPEDNQRDDHGSAPDPRPSLGGRLRPCGGPVRASARGAARRLSPQRPAGAQGEGVPRGDLRRGGGEVEHVEGRAEGHSGAQPHPEGAGRRLRVGATDVVPAETQGRARAVLPRQRGSGGQVPEPGRLVSGAYRRDALHHRRAAARGEAV